MNPETRVRALAGEYLRGRIDRRELLRAAAALGLGAPAIAGLVGAAMPRGAMAQEGGFGNTPKGPKVDKLVVWTRSSPDAPDNTEFANITAMANAYTAAIGTPVEVITVPDADFKNKMGLAAPNGQGPDVFGPIAHDWIGEFAVQGIAAEIPDGLVDGMEDFLPVAIDAAKFEGKSFGVPIFVESVALIYNKDMVPTPPATWDELVAKATELTAGDVYGFGFPLLEQYHEGGFFNGMGGYVFRFEEGQFDIGDIGLNNDGGVGAAKLLRDMYHQQKPPMPAAAIDRANMHKAQEGMMEAKQLAMTINGPWREAPLTKAGVNYGVAKLPTLPNGEPMRPFLGVQVWAANSYSKNKDAALDFVGFATGTNSVLELYKGFIKAPARQSAATNPAVTANPNVQTWLAQAADGVPMPNIPEMSSVWKPWGDAMDGIIPKNAPDDQTKTLLDNAVDQIKTAIEEADS
ncbi:MAG: arabinogalactan oligomer / maltooligosaccharide transport system substrate-binding protein [Thermomicrobiales bacterium]|nr:arabinogalactan oligomer / maltooligosaccharide transport system substrate-binding protein [Thermomicrobiales bacterium]